MLLSRKSLLVLLAGAALAAPTQAQVTTPPGPKPEPTAPYTPPPAPPAPPPRPARPAREVAPDVDYNPITERDTSGAIIPLTEPPEYVAMAHNPLINLPMMIRIAPQFYTRRMAVERLVIDNLEIMREIEGGMIEQMRMGDEQGMRDASSKISAFTTNDEIGPYLSAHLDEAGITGHAVNLLTAKIRGEYENDLTKEAMASKPTADGATGLDQMMQKVLRMSVTEHEYFYRRLMMDAADQFSAVLPQLGLDGAAADAVRPLAERLEVEGDLDARAALIRQVFDLFDAETRKRALELTVELRPAINPDSQMPPLPENALPRSIDDETRMEMILQLLDGGRVDTSKFVN
jgi:hypothetical protein